MLQDICNTPTLLDCVRRRKSALGESLELRRASPSRLPCSHRLYYMNIHNATSVPCVADDCVLRREAQKSEVQSDVDALIGRGRERSPAPLGGADVRAREAQRADFEIRPWAETFVFNKAI